MEEEFSRVKMCNLLTERVIQVGKRVKVKVRPLSRSTTTLVGVWKQRLVQSLHLVPADVSLSLNVSAAREHIGGLFFFLKAHKLPDLDR